MPRATQTKSASSRTRPPAALLVHDEQVPLKIRKYRGSRRMTLRYNPLKHEVCLSLPYYVSVAEGMRFVTSRHDWLKEQMAVTRSRTRLEDGARLSVFGVGYTITHVQGSREAVRAEDGRIYVGGEKDFLARRVRDWVKAATRREIEQLATHYADALGKTVRRIRLRDTSSCWGSCTSDGYLNFSWRLAFAPREVMEYVVAHEVAHLVEMNHTPRFWQVVAHIYPGYERHKTWLRRHGHELYTVG